MQRNPNIADSAFYSFFISLIMQISLLGILFILDCSIAYEQNKL